MLFSYILLECSFMDNLPVGLALCIIPFLLGWLAAYAYHKVGQLRESVASLTASNNSLTNELTELRVKLTQAEADIEAKGEQVRKAKSDLIMCESERNALREQVANAGKPAKPATIMFAGTKWKWDDLKIVEGIGPKIAELFSKAGIKTWKQLAETAVSKLKEILDSGGSQYNIHDPGTWPEQARLADAGKWDELKKLQDELTAGR